MKFQPFQLDIVLSKRLSTALKPSTHALALSIFHSLYINVSSMKFN